MVFFSYLSRRSLGWIRPPPYFLILYARQESKPAESSRICKGNTSRVSAVYTAPPRGTFIAALKDIPEVWEIYYTDDHEPVYNGFVHDYRMKEGMAEKGPFPVRRIELDDYLDDFFFDQEYEHLIGTGAVSGPVQQSQTYSGPWAP